MHALFVSASTGQSCGDSQPSFQAMSDVSQILSTACADCMGHLGKCRPKADNGVPETTFGESVR